MKAFEEIPKVSSMAECILGISCGKSGFLQAIALCAQFFAIPRNHGF
ncbi:MAG: hypothetical protein IK099_05645 [Clostridia bacterium]|nr:hypothetical protein [Clostridia bacterium]